MLQNLTGYLCGLGNRYSLLLSYGRLKFNKLIEFSIGRRVQVWPHSCQSLKRHSLTPFKFRAASSRSPGPTSCKLENQSRLAVIYAPRAFLPRRRHFVPMRLTNTPLWLYFKSVRSSEKSVKL